MAIEDVSDGDEKEILLVAVQPARNAALGGSRAPLQLTERAPLCVPPCANISGKSPAPEWLERVLEGQNKMLEKTLERQNKLLEKTLDGQKKLQQDMWDGQERIFNKIDQRQEVLEQLQVEFTRLLGEMNTRVGAVEEQMKQRNDSQRRGRRVDSHEGATKRGATASDGARWTLKMLDALKRARLQPNRLRGAIGASPLPSYSLVS